MVFSLLSKGEAGSQWRRQGLALSHPEGPNKLELIPLILSGWFFETLTWVCLEEWFGVVTAAPLSVL